MERLSLRMGKGGSAQPNESVTAEHFTFLTPGAGAATSSVDALSGLGAVKLGEPYGERTLWRTVQAQVVGTVPWVCGRASWGAVVPLLSLEVVGPPEISAASS
jgi:hypothetical protein